MVGYLFEPQEGTTMTDVTETVGELVDDSPGVTDCLIRGIDYECGWCGDQGCTCWT